MFAYSSRVSLPASISLSLCSHSPVSSGEASSTRCSMCSAKSSENALGVGTSSRPSRTTYSSRISPSMVAARVAGVPSPFASIAARSSSSSTSLPAPSMAESSVASV